MNFPTGDAAREAASQERATDGTPPARGDSSPGPLPEWLIAARAFVAQFDEFVSDLDGTFPSNPGCVACTYGATPDRYNTGLCGYHAMRAAIAKAAP